MTFSDRLSRMCDRAVLPVGLALVLYQSIMVWYSLHGALLHYLTHLSLVLVVAALMVGASAVTRTTPLARTITLACAVCGLIAAAACGLFFYAQAENLEIIQPFIDTQTMTMGVLLVVTVLIVTWQIWGVGLALICASATLYFAFGHLLPGVFAISPQPTNVIVSFLAGIGGPRGVLSYAPLSADVIFLLLVYGGLMHGCRVIDMFGEIGGAIGNLFRGGVAYSAIAASTLIGMVTGQAVSNIALSGIMTIPSMTRNGFTREQAGAVEVLASTGSQLLPPIMGLGAFLMAVILGVSYIEIVFAALIPGVMYMLAVCIGVYALICRSESVPYVRVTVDWAKIRWIAPSFIVSFTVLIVLLYLRYSPAMAGFWGMALLLAGTALRPAAHRPTVAGLFAGIREGIMTAVQLALVLAAIGMVVQTLTTTGTGVALGRTVSMFADGNLWTGLLIGMLVSLFIGMGLPTPAAYALIAIVVVPALIDVGLSPLKANMFGFYFAIFSTLTPPVAVGILTAARISGGSFMGTALECVKLGGVCFAVPFIFVIVGGFLDFDNFTLETALVFVLFVTTTAMMAGAIFGALGRRLSAVERAIFIVAGPMTLILYLITSWLALGLFGPAVFALWLGARIIRSKPAVASGPAGDGGLK